LPSIGDLHYIHMYKKSSIKRPLCSSVTSRAGWGDCHIFQSAAWCLPSGSQTRHSVSINSKMFPTKLVYFYLCYHFVLILSIWPVESETGNIAVLLNLSLKYCYMLWNYFSLCRAIKKSKIMLVRPTKANRSEQIPKIVNIFFHHVLVHNLM